MSGGVEAHRHTTNLPLGAMNLIHSRACLPLLYTWMAGAEPTLSSFHCSNQISARVIFAERVLNSFYWRKIVLFLAATEPRLVRLAPVLDTSLLPHVGMCCSLLSIRALDCCY